jgi:tRNA(Arg) A34 adenosine deaminase TadA
MDNEHVPNPKPWEEWTAEDEMKFRMFSSHCPMCAYKWEYASLQKLVQAANNTQDERIVATLVPEVTRKSNELLELGLFIASTVDNANKQAGMAGHN